MRWTTGRALEIFDDFRHRRGSHLIASAFALDGILREVERTRPRAVLELGPGIGATTRALVDGLDRGAGRDGWHLVAVEENDFCTAELVANLGADAERIELVSTLGDAATRSTFDFVLIDGPGSLRDDVGRLSSRAVVFVENLRADQRDELDAILPRPWVARSAWPMLTTEQMGGFHVYQLDPTALERASFRLRGTAHAAAMRARPLVRRGLVKLRLGRLLDEFARRADRGRISEQERRDPEVTYEG